MTAHKSQNLLALLWRLISVWLSSLKGWLIVFVAILLCGLAIVTLLKPPEVNLATFNIQEYPQSDEQATAALKLAESLEVDALGVQEITDADHFSEHVDTYLGTEWEVVFADQPQVRHGVAFAFDQTKFELGETHTHHETAVKRGARATLEVRLRAEGVLSERNLRVFVVHLKAGGDSGEIRKEQLRRLRPIIEGAVSSGDEVALLGDFNTTGDADREALATLAEKTELQWHSEQLPCTSYWNRSDDCPTTALDHILASEDADSVDVAGACKSVGCQSQDRCPVYVDKISDHCPVRSTF